MPNNLLLLPLLGGFLLLHFTHIFRFRAQRLESYRLLIESAVVGVILTAVSRALVLLIGATPLGRWCTEPWWGFCPLPHGDTAAWSIVLGAAFPLVGNRIYPLAEAKERTIRKHGNALLRLLNDAERGKQLISLTLTNLKWYVGYVKESPSFDPQEVYLRILPIMSGYRDRETLETFRTVFYRDVIDTESSREFLITLPIADVKTANLFDPDLYEEHFAENGKQTAEGDADHPVATP